MSVDLGTRMGFVPNGATALERLCLGARERNEPRVLRRSFLAGGIATTPSTPHDGTMMAFAPTHRGLGVTANLDAGVARELAAQCEELGYHSLWSNDEPDARGLDTLAAFSAATAKLQLGVGVLPLHRYQPVQIAAEVDRLEIDPARLWLGIGSGALSGQIDAIQRAAAELRGLLPEATRLVVAAMRPRLCRLGGGVADGVLLNWMLPGQAARARGWVHEGAAGRGHSAPIVASYVRVALGQGANRRLREEEGFYRSINEGHRKHFAAMDVAVGSVGIEASRRSDLLEALAPYHSALDLPIVRVLADADATSLGAVADAAAP